MFLARVSLSSRNCFITWANVLRVFLPEKSDFLKQPKKLSYIWVTFVTKYATKNIQSGHTVSLKSKKFLTHTATCLKWCTTVTNAATSKQCDQVVRLFFKIWPFVTIKISPIMSQICQSIINKPSKICQRLVDF